MKKLLSIIAIIFLFSLCVHIGRALADVAANTRIVNQATLTFDDGSGISQTVNAAVTVTVAHVPGVPTLDAPGNGAIPYTVVNTPLPFTYTITAGGNGPDTYTISSTIFSQTNNGNDAGGCRSWIHSFRRHHHHRRQHRCRSAGAFRWQQQRQCR